MRPSTTRILRATRILLLALGAWIVHQAPASAQYLGYGGYGGMGYGGMGYGGMGYGGMGYGGMGYGGLGYGGMGYGGLGYGGFGMGGYGYGYPGYANVGGGFLSGGYYGVGYPGVGYPGIGWQNPYFSFGLSPLAVQNAAFERAVLGRTTPPLQSSLRPAQPAAAPPNPVNSGQVGTGTFGNR
jgi:hypothetical protein